MNVWTRLVRTGDSHVPLVLRLGLGLVILPHGLQKVFGWFGGFGFEGTMAFFTDSLGIPYLLGLAAIVAESLGAVLLIVGLATRLWALAIGITMLVAMLVVHAPYGFFMDWYGAQGGQGIEFFLLALALAGGLVITGGGRFSLDRAVIRQSTADTRLDS